MIVRIAMAGRNPFQRRPPCQLAEKSATRACAGRHGREVTDLGSLEPNMDQRGSHAGGGGCTTHSFDA